MTVQGTHLDMLQAIADIQRVMTSNEVEDVQIAEEIGLDVGLVRGALRALAEMGYIKLETVKTNSGLAYRASLTPDGAMTLDESRIVSERLTHI
ncbi:MAG: hypothetical protein HYR94_19820 [Chloroflexi bacterium]|nr:hypothetical protein [Chloroflexota bacterium]